MEPVTPNKNNILNNKFKIKYFNDENLEFNDFFFVNFERISEE